MARERSTVPSLADSNLGQQQRAKWSNTKSWFVAVKIILKSQGILHLLAMKTRINNLSSGVGQNLFTKSI